MTVKQHLWDGNNGEQLYIDSVQTPGYWQKKAKGLLLPVNPLLLIRRDWHQPSVRLNSVDVRYFTQLLGQSGLEIDAKLTNGNGLFSNQYGTTVPSSAKLSHQVRSIDQQRVTATNKLVKKLNERDIDLGVALAESRETAHYVQSAMIKTFVIAKALLKKRGISGALNAAGLTSTTRGFGQGRQQLREVMDAAAGTQLSLTYALKPLVADVFGAVTALEKRWDVPYIITARASVSDELDIKLFNPNVGFPGDASSEGVRGEYREYSGAYKTRAALTFQVDNPFTYTLSKLGLLNPLELVWEATTLSFVVDWFLPIGDWFAGLVPPQGVSIVNGHLTTTLRARSKLELLYRQPPVPFGNKLVVIPVRSEEKYKRRTSITSFPRYHIVGANFDLSRDQVMSGISLLWSLGMSRKSQAKAYNDAVSLNSRGYTNIAGKSKETWSSRGGSPFPMDYAAL